MNNSVMVEIENIVKVFGKVTAVNNVSLKINEGEFVSLLGPSGCGKTTLLRMIGGLENPTSGNIYLQGKLINKIKAHKRPINMVFQRYALFPHMNVFENIAFGPKIKKVPKNEIKKKVTEMLKLVRLEGFENRMSNELSGGQCQRVAVARALINEPLVLLLDEPLGALDLKLRKVMQIELRNIQRSLGGTFIYVTHDQEEALVLSDRIMIMNDGNIVQTGSPIDIYKNPNTVFSSKFIGESNLLEGSIKALSKTDDTLDVEVGNSIIKTYYRNDIDSNEKIFLSIRLENVVISKEKINDFENIYNGIIKNSIFLGPIIKYELEVPELNSTLNAIIDTGSIQNQYFSIGDEVKLSWDKYSSNILIK